MNGNCDTMNIAIITAGYFFKYRDYFRVNLRGASNVLFDNFVAYYTVSQNMM